MERDVIDIEFTPQERKLILRYGYPFEGIQQAFQACQASNQIETIPVEAFELEPTTATRRCPSVTFASPSMRRKAAQSSRGNCSTCATGWKPPNATAKAN